MKYINQLNDEQLMELVKYYCGEDDFKQIIDIDRDDNSIDITVEIEFEDETGELINCEDSYTLYDYKVTIYDWSGDASNCLKLYRQWLLNKFGNQYAIDYLLG